MSMVNPAYKFVESVATLYDRGRFPTTVDQNGKLLCTGPALEPLRQAEGSYFAEVPWGVLGIIAGYTSTNTQNFFHTTGQLNLKPKSRPHQQSLIDFTAPHFAQRIGLVASNERSHLEEIWDEVFTAAYAQANDEEKQRIILLAANIDHEVMKEKAWESALYYVGKVAGMIFNNIGVRVLCGLYIWWKLNQLWKVVMNQIKTVYVPRMMNRLINHVSVENIQRLNHVLKGLEKVYLYRFCIFLICLGVGLTIGRFIPLVGSVAKRVTDLIYLPQTMMELPGELVWKATSYSWYAQHQFAVKLQAHSNKKLQNIFDSRGQKAYLVWMAQCKVARERGISFHAG